MRGKEEEDDDKEDVKVEDSVAERPVQGRGREEAGRRA